MFPIFGPPHNKSLDASGGSAIRNLLRAAQGALIRAAASTQPFGRFTTMIAILYGSSVVLLIAAIFFWFHDGRRRVTNPARQLFVWVSLLALTGAVLLFVRFLWVVGSPEFVHLSLMERIDVTRPIVRVGFRLAVAALLSCWFGTLKTTICAAVSSGAISLLWVLAAME